MNRSPVRPAVPSKSTSRGSLLPIGVGVIVAVVIVVASFQVPAFGSKAHPPVVPGSTVLGAATGPAVALEGGFLGVNVRADVAALTSSGATAISSTPARLVRWPGGALADRLAMLGDNDQGLVYQDNGSSSPALVSLASFAEWCRSFQCQSIITLPGEINDSAYAAEIVSYAVSDLSFSPTYWEIGNEPALWTHFGISWTSWNATQNLPASPEQYAHVVQAYVTAIRAVDPSARFLGLPGVGKGGGGDSLWIEDTVQLNGPNLSGVAVHVYPMGSLSGPEGLTSWFNSLTGPNGLPDQVEAASAAIHRACSSCTISLLADEFGAATNVTPQDGLSGGNLVAYIAAEITQGLSLPVVSLDYYVFQGGTYGAWFDISGRASSTFGLYEGLSQYLGAYAAPLAVRASAGGLLAALGGPSPAEMDDVLLVNTNASTTFWVNLSASFPSASAGTVWAWNGPASGPSVGSIGEGGAVNWTVPPASLVIFSSLGTPDPELRPAPQRLSSDFASVAYALRGGLATVGNASATIASPWAAPRRVALARGGVRTVPSRKIKWVHGGPRRVGRGHREPPRVGLLRGSPRGKPWPQER